MSDAPEITVETDVSAEKPERPSRVAIVGKSITFANFILAILFLTVAVFFRVNKIEALEKKRQLEETTRALETIEKDRKQVADTLTQEKEQVQRRLEDVSKNAKTDIGGIESQIATLRGVIDKARQKQEELNKEADQLEAQHAEMMQQINALRSDRENTHGAEEGLTADRLHLEDQLAKTLNELRQAEARGQEIERHLADLSRVPAP